LWGKRVGQICPGAGSVLSNCRPATSRSQLRQVQPPQRTAKRLAGPIFAAPKKCARALARTFGPLTNSPRTSDNFLSARKVRSHFSQRLRSTERIPPAAQHNF
jgi:hypothetical protein